MKLLVTALRPEAEPFIEYLGLKRDLSITSHEVYRDKEYALIITGTGAVSGAIGTTLLIERYGSPQSVLCNIGIAGAPEEFQIGELIQISSISHPSAKQSYHPELLLNLKGKEASLITVDQPLVERTSSWPGDTLADMEGAGVFQSAIHFLPLEQIFFLKVVSDHFSKSEISKSVIKELISKHVTVVLDSLSALSELIESSTRSPLNDSERALLHEVSRSLKLTSAQETTLYQNALSARVQRNASFDSLKSFTEMPSESKQERAKAFKELLGAIASS